MFNELDDLIEMGEYYSVADYLASKISLDPNTPVYTLTVYDALTVLAYSLLDSEGLPETLKELGPQGLEAALKTMTPGAFDLEGWFNELQNEVKARVIIEALAKTKKKEEGK